MPEDAEGAPELPPKNELETMDEFEQARKDYEKRVNRQLAEHGPAYVRVTYPGTDERPPMYEPLQRLHEDARHRDKSGLILVEQETRSGANQVLGLTLLSTARKDGHRAQSLHQFLDRYLIKQRETTRSLDEVVSGSQQGTNKSLWSSVKREAQAVGRMPLLVYAIHGTRSGTVLAPLSWFLAKIPHAVEASTA